MKTKDKDKTKAKSPAKSVRPIPQSAREYLQYIGALGGLTSRRALATNQARRMVAIREAKRLLIKQGKPELARDRWPLKVKAEYTDIRRPAPTMSRQQIQPVRFKN